MTAAGVKIIQNQVPELLGEQGVTLNFTAQIPDIIAKSNTIEPLAVAIGVSSLVLLVGLQFIGKRFGYKSRIIRILSISRNAIVIVIFTFISTFVNTKLAIPQFPIAGDIPRGLNAPMGPPPSDLLFFIGTKSIPIFIATALEHLVIAKAFGTRNNYRIDKSQELVFLGVTNLVNGALGGMPVGGSIDRTAINSASGVKSPLSGLFTTGLVLLAIQELNGFFKYIPRASIAAIILVTVGGIIPSVRIFVKYWKTSFADFAAFLVVLQFSFLQSLELGIGGGVVVMVGYTLGRTLLEHARPVSGLDVESRFAKGENYRPVLPGGIFPQESQVVAIDSQVMFLNADRVKTDIMDAVMTYHSPAERMAEETRVWNDRERQHVATLRYKAKVSTPMRFIPQLHVLILDFSRVSFIDITGFEALQDMKTEIAAFAGPEVEIRFVGLNGYLRSKFQRFGWPLATWREAEIGLVPGIDIFFDDLRDAVAAPKRLPAADSVSL